MCAYSFPNNLRHLFAFSHSLPSEPLYLTQVEQYDPIQEFSRLGITDVKANGELSSWKLSSINCDYRVCNTYPQVFVIPRILSDGTHLLTALLTHSMAYSLTDLRTHSLTYALTH